jgi:hypothetical protein
MCRADRKSRCTVHRRRMSYEAVTKGSARTDGPQQRRQACCNNPSGWTDEPLQPQTEVLQVMSAVSRIATNETIQFGDHAERGGDRTRPMPQCRKPTSGPRVPLKDMKEAFPVQTAEYAVANKVAKQTRPETRDRMIKKVKSRYWKRSHKYGVELPKSVKEALAVDTKSGTTFWKDAIEMEMKNVMPAFEFQDDDKMPIGSQKTKYTLKNNSVAEPTVYLGAKVSKHYIAESAERNKPRWSLSAEDYVKQAVKDAETELDKAFHIFGSLKRHESCL